MKYIIFGAGQIGHEAIELLGEENINYFIDNDETKRDLYVAGKKVYSFEQGIKSRGTEKIVIAVSKIYENQLENQLNENHVEDYCFFGQLKVEITKKRILSRPDYIGIYKKAVGWILNNSVISEGIINNSKLRKSYPEVTGYYIPTLIRWGYRELAISYAKWLCSIQKEDGSWYDTLDEDPYIFDSAQILKGLIAVRDIYPDITQVDETIKRGCDWILSCMTEEGQLKTPSEVAWGNIANELIHTYCLAPLKQAAVLYNEPRYQESANRSLNYYKQYFYNEIVNFSMLSHFYAYVVEAMLDMGEIEIAREAMKNMENFQKESGAVPAYKDVDWICSTGLFQLSLIWFRLGDIDRGNKAFEYACRLQNNSGGWYGSYISEENAEEINTYFPDAEISWANKYFLDALYYKNKAEFDLNFDIFLENISKDDERYCCVRDIVKEYNSNVKILDVGCGKGRYLKSLVCDIPNRKYYGVDISTKVMGRLDKEGIECHEGTLTNIPYADDTFSVVYACEALEHAVDIKSSVNEMVRVTQSNGCIIIIDKNDDNYGAIEIGKWEQWLNENELKEILSQYCKEVTVKRGLKYEGMDNPELFTAWIGIVR